MDKSIVSVNQLAVRSSTCYEFSNPNEAEVVVIEDDDTSVEAVEKQIENLKLNYQFNVKDVPQIFQNLIKGKMNNLKKIETEIFDDFCLISFDDIEIWVEAERNVWFIRYENIEEKITSTDPEKLIVGLLWFVLRNPNIKLFKLTINIWEPESELNSQNQYYEELDDEKLNTLLQSMFDTFDHQIQTGIFNCERINKYTLFSILKHTEPGTLKEIDIDVTSNKEEKSQKLKEIVEMDQWKQAKEIYSYGVNLLEIEDVLHCEVFLLTNNIITLEDLLLVTEHVLNSASKKCCTLSAKDKNVDVEAIIDFLHSKIDGLIITKTKAINFPEAFCYWIVKSDHQHSLMVDGHEITIRNY